MAKCSKCGANVGCGCQLINGMCAYCNGQIKKCYHPDLQNV